MKTTWSTVPFLEAVEDVTRGHVKTKQRDYLSAGAIPIVDQGADLIGGYTDDPAAASHLEPPVIIFGDHTRCVKYVDFQFGAGADGVKVLRPRGDMDSRFLYWFLRSVQLPASGYSRHFKFLKDVRVPVPARDEQRHIASILDAADTLRTMRRQARDKLDILTTALFIDMFGHPLQKGMPWSTAAIAELGQVVTGRTPPGSKDGMYGNAIPFVTPGDLESSAPPERWLSELGAKHVRIVPPGSTLVCCIGTIGKVGQAVVDSAFNQQINAVDWDRDHIAPAFGTESMRLMKAELARRGSSTTLPLLNKSSFEAVELPVPPLTEQRKFESIVLDIATRRLLHEDALERHGVLLDSLQQRAFAGEL